MAHQRNRRKPMAQINVVPYIDVMLVLLVIFMVTAPMMQQGVTVDLPQAPAQPVTEEPEEQIVIAVDGQGRFFVDADGPDAVPLSAQALTNRITDMLRERKDKTVYVRGDAGVSYGRVVEAMAALQAAGASSVGLITEQPEKKR